MKYKLTFLIIFFNFLAFSQIIEWSPNSKLTRNDFQGIIPGNTINHAGTSYNVSYEIMSTSIWTGKIQIRTYAIFNREESWLNETYYTDGLLNHEQGHFDIAQIFAYKLQRLINKEIKNSKDFNSKISDLIKIIGDECIAFQEKYDLVTDHGTILEKQKEYDEIIEEYLRSNNYR
ncbi:DUF922 domain-containing protein [Kaistella pullorum]|uniref:DUF922 domain-containing protein n=1 Tax=Kaistella pullorum TaxID=2763074 RepID=A0ABR8WPY9_9FLAO|nr:hypothetical protein [Kaistella pullorum]MBD8019133.1 hypothetical protein [Kaistella pullorum]